jgi:predicted nucleic acid-binding protein
VIVLDTNVLSEFMSASTHPSVYRWASQQPNEQLYTTTISMAEIFQGIELLPAGKRRAGLLGAAESMFTALFRGRVLPFDEAAARAFVLIAIDRRKRGRPVSLFDAQIAAIAKARDANLATRDTSDFEGCGLTLINPWQL